MAQIQRSFMHRNKLTLLKPAFEAAQGLRVGDAQLLCFHHRRCIGTSLHHIAHRFARQQALRVGMLRMAQNLAHAALLHQMPLLHHRDAVGKLAHQIQIMRDQQHRHAMLGLQSADQIQNLQTKRHI